MCPFVYCSGINLLHPLYGKQNRKKFAVFFWLFVPDHVRICKFKAPSIMGKKSSSYIRNVSFFKKKKYKKKYKNQYKTKWGNYSAFTQIGIHVKLTYDLQKKIKRKKITRIHCTTNNKNTY